MVHHRGGPRLRGDGRQLDQCGVAQRRVGDDGRLMVPGVLGPGIRRVPTRSAFVRPTVARQVAEIRPEQAVSRQKSPRSRDVIMPIASPPSRAISLSDSHFERVEVLRQVGVAHLAPDDAVGGDETGPLWGAQLSRRKGA
jgi:hypothetical protein